MFDWQNCQKSTLENNIYNKYNGRAFLTLQKILQPKNSPIEFPFQTNKKRPNVCFGKFDPTNQSKFCKSLSSFRGVINRPADLPVSPRGFGDTKLFPEVKKRRCEAVFLEKESSYTTLTKHWRLDSKQMMLWLENVSLHSSVDIFGIYLEFRGCMFYIYVYNLGPAKTQ